MTCARREAGARRPAPSTSAGSPRRPEPRPGRFRARLFRLLPALALLLGAVSLFHAAPAQAQNPAWEATLNPVNLGAFGVGCINAATQASARCSNTAVLTEDEISTRTITGIQQGTSSITVTVGATALPANLRALNFCVGSTALSLSGATSTQFTLSTPTPLIVVGTQIKLAIQASCAPPAAPTGLSVGSDDRTLKLNWTAPSGTVTGYDVHYTSAAAGTVTNSATASGSNPSAAWVAVTRSGTTASSEIYPLSNGITYRVRVRATNTGGSSAWVFGSGTPALIFQWAIATASIAESESSALQPRIGPGSGTGNPITAAASGTLTYAAGSSNPASLADDLTSGYATTFSFAANAQPKIVLPLPVNDTVNEAHETFTVTINAGTGYTVGTRATITVTINDNDPPAAPSGLSLTAGNAQLTASWTKPAGPVAGYQLRYKEASATDQTATTANDPSTGWVTATLQSTVTRSAVPGLTNATSYDVQVRATDGQTGTGNGYGDWSASQSGRPAAQGASDAPPENTGINAQRPTNLAVGEGDQRLNLTWTANVEGSSVGGGHWVQYKKAADSDWTTATSSLGHAATGYNITGLENGTAYDVRIFAVARNSAAQVIRTSFVTGHGTPAAPISNDATLSGVTASGSTSGTGTFTAVPLAPSFRANRLAYEATVASSVTHVKVTPTTTHSAATVEVGKGSTLATVTSGSASAAIAVSAGSNAITVKVTAEDGSTTRTYTVTVTRQAAQGSRLTGLSMTAGGTAVTLSPAFATGKHWYKAVVPAGTASVSVTPTWTQTLNVEAASVSLDTNRPVTNSGAIASSGTAKSLDLATSGITRVGVVAALSTGNGAAGTYYIDVTRLPAAPTGLTFTPGDTQLSLTWVKPAGPVTGYDVHYTSADADTAGNDAAASGSDPSAAWVDDSHSGTVTAQTISDLTNDIPYRVRVRAVNADGDGAWVFGTETPVGTPVVSFADINLAPVEGASSFVVTLTIAPVLATTSSVRLVLAPSATRFDEFTGLPLTVTLPAGTASVEVDLAPNLPADNAVNNLDAGGNLLLEAVSNAPYELGAAGANLTVSDNEPPAAPAGLSLAPGDRKLTASWTKPAGPVLYYQLRHKEASAADRDATTAGDPSTGWVTIRLNRPDAQSEVPTTADITLLPGETAYQAQVRATDGQLSAGNGWGDWSAVQTATTPVTVSRTPDPDLLTGLTLHDGTRALYLDANANDGKVGLGGPDAIYPVQVNPGIRSVAVTLAWTNSAITSVTGSVRYYDSRRSDGGTLTWSSSGATVPLVMQSPLGGPGHPLLTLTVNGVTSQSYRIYFQQNFDWKNANDRLGRILMSIPSSGQGAGQ